MELKTPSEITRWLEEEKDIDTSGLSGDELVMLHDALQCPWPHRDCNLLGCFTEPHPCEEPREPCNFRECNVPSIYDCLDCSAYWADVYDLYMSRKRKLVT